MNGIILVNKPKNWTSRDVINKLTHLLGTKKIGHTGTLDPIATGVLVVTVGKYTKLNEVLMSTYKEYIAEFKLGIVTDTLDITGKFLKENDVILNEEEIINGIMHFKGKYNQEVPIYSSVKVMGKKLYEYARNNESVSLPKREVDIKEIEVLEINNDVVKVKCLVSKGTYIRSLIRDIGDYLKCGATMTSLIRTKQGIFAIENTSTLDDIENNNYHLLKIKDVLDVQIISLNNELEKKVINGQKLINNNYKKDYLLFIKDNKEICLYKKENDYYKMFLFIDEK